MIGHWHGPTTVVKNRLAAPGMELDVDPAEAPALVRLGWFSPVKESLTTDPAPPPPESAAEPPAAPPQRINRTRRNNGT
jgi:hypothetical protein